MIRYSLKCTEGHSFDSWFQSADAYDALAARGMVACVVCGGTDVQKAIMAPRVSNVDETTVKPAEPAPERPLSVPSHPAEQVLRAMRDYVEKHSTYVGKRFADEARAMHLGDSDARPIHGEASPEDARALIEDGIKIAPLPVLPPEKSN